jgi:hypothetical protein
MLRRKMSSVKEKNEEVARQLQKAGIDVKPYARGPLGSDIFTIRVDPTGNGTVRLYTGLADVTVIPNKKKKQAVLQVKERQRSITREFTQEYRVDGMMTETRARERAIRDSEVQFRNAVVLPNASYSHEVEKLPQVKKPPKYSGGIEHIYYAFKVKVTAKTTRSSETLLVGIDENNHFIAALPRKVDSVEEAHEALRPKGVPKDAPRQGEWFFVPATEQEKKAVEALVKRNPLRERQRGWARNTDSKIELGGGHVALIGYIVKGKRYVVGYVVDTRPNSRHEPLWLPDWHRVVRNAEKNLASRGRSAISTESTAYWD